MHTWGEVFLAANRELPRIMVKIREALFLPSDHSYAFVWSGRFLVIDNSTSRFIYFDVPISHGIYSLHPVSDCTLTIGTSRILTHRKPRKVLKTRGPRLVQIVSERA
jgi:hypothetical protein